MGSASLTEVVDAERNQVTRQDGVKVWCEGLSHERLNYSAVLLELGEESLGWPEGGVNRDELV